MRRYQVLVEANFPAELNQLFKGMENKGNPWNMSPTARMDWAQGPAVRGQGRRRGGPSSRSTRSSGCSGSAVPAPTRTGRRRPPARSPSCCDMADVSFAVLGNGETCTGDQARRAGNEFVFQRLGHAERRDVQGVQGQEGRLDLRPLLQHLEERVHRVRRRARGHAPHPAAQPAGPRGQAHPDRRRCRGAPSGRSPTTTPATSAATTASTPRHASCSRCCPAPSTSRWSATPSGPSAAAPVAPGCGWRRTSASGSTSTAPTRRSAPAPTRSRSAARSAG